MSLRLSVECMPGPVFKAVFTRLESFAGWAFSTARNLTRSRCLQTSALVAVGYLIMRRRSVSFGVVGRHASHTLNYGGQDEWSFKTFRYYHSNARDGILMTMSCNIGPPLSRGTGQQL